MAKKNNVHREKTIPLPSLSLIIPCYNEEESINHLSQQLNLVLQQLHQQWNVELIFVDDGSKDKTHELLQKHYGTLPYVKIVKHEHNKNLGAAIRTGLAAAQGDIIVTMDSDCTYPPTEIIPMLSMLTPDVDIVTASPYHPEGHVENIPSYRLFLSNSISLIYRLLTGAKIHTFTALFRAQRKHAVKNIPFKSDNFLATAELLIGAIEQGYHVKEYPTTLHVRKYGVSKMRLAKVIKSHARYASSLVPKALIRTIGIKTKKQNVPPSRNA